jgi:hypothetical protein
VQFSSTVANKLPELDLPVKRENAFFVLFVRGWAALKSGESG